MLTPSHPRIRLIFTLQIVLGASAPWRGPLGRASLTPYAATLAGNSFTISDTKCLASPNSISVLSR